MDAEHVNMLIAMYGSKFPDRALPTLKREFAMMNYDEALLILSEMKDSTIAVILSVLAGSFGVDRFYIGDVGKGIGKLLTCGGAGIWTIIDCFLIMNATREKNFKKFLSNRPMRQ